MVSLLTEYNYELNHFVKWKFKNLFLKKIQVRLGMIEQSRSFNPF